MTITVTPNCKDLYLPYDQSRVVNNIMNSTHLGIISLAELIASYISTQNVFGAKEWVKYFDLDVVDPEPVFDFYKFWWGPDPLTPSKQVCETHIPPVLRPRLVRDINKNIEMFDFALLSKIIKTPKEGRASKYVEGDSQLLEVLIPKKYISRIDEEPISWIIMRKDVFGRNRTYLDIQGSVEKLNDSTKAGYETCYSVIDVSTVVLAQYVMNGQYHLGTETGMEGRITRAFVMEDYLIHTRTFFAETFLFRGVVGQFSRENGLSLNTYQENEKSAETGIVLMRKFNNENKSEEPCVIF